MSLRLDHVFVCVGLDGPEARALLEVGLVEGSPNVHPGQGTANRRFFFQHGFLELLWVHDAREATSARTAPTRLWERWTGRAGPANPFGLCFSSPTGIEGPLPFDTWTYAPTYLPPERTITFAAGTTLAEPELFVLGWPIPPDAAAREPRTHRVPLEAMLGVSVGLRDPGAISAPLRAARDAGWLRVHGSAEPELVVEFAAPRAVQVTLPELGLTLRGEVRARDGGRPAPRRPPSRGRGPG